MKFDTIVITAADESQAACFRLQAKAFAGVLARRILVVPDPGISAGAAAAKQSLDIMGTIHFKPYQALWK